MSTSLRRAGGAAVLLVLLTAGVASAHATLLQKTAPAGTVQALTLRMPGEQAPAYTTKVVTEVLAGFTEVACGPKAGWTCAVTPDTTQGRSALITWTRQGTGKSGIDLLPFTVRTPYTGGAFAFQTTQTYSNGAKAFWDDTEEPAPKLTVTGTAVSPTPAAPTAAPSPTVTRGAPPLVSEPDGGPSTALIGGLSAVALLAGLGFYLVRR